MYKLVEFTKTKVFFIGVQLPNYSTKESVSSMEEAIFLAKTLNLNPLGHQIQKRNQIHTRSFIGKGKCEELVNLFMSLKPELLFVDGNITLQQEKNLSQYFGIEVWDKTKVILKIFEKHARNSEAKEQVELATLEYMLPRLSGMWQHLDREKGGARASKGMGEKQINIDKNLIRKRIFRLKKKVQKYKNTVQQQLKRGLQVFRVSLIGYTNAGKSSLMQALTHSKLLIEDKLFSTLGTTTRKIKGVATPQILLSDTVGFIHNLPHTLIASFRSTFSAIRESNLLLHVIELDQPEKMEKSLKVSEEILLDLKLNAIPRIVVINKIDKHEFNKNLHPLYAPKDAIWVSCFQEHTIELLKKNIQVFFEKKFVYKKYSLPYTSGKAITFLYQNSIIKKIEQKYQTIDFEVCLSARDADRFAKNY